MVPNSEKLMEVFIGGLPRSIEGNVTASKPQTLEEVITITQRLMELVIKHKFAQEADDHKRKFEDRRNTTGNNNNQSNNQTLQVMDTGCRLVFCFCSTWSGGPGKVSIIPTVFSWIDSISSDGFLPFILLLV
nr:hypothetical protein [Tanacetum cinerariifolium]